jgi:ABC-type nitrate/sulfonate/bicarbonate transport system permease component
LLVPGALVVVWWLTSSAIASPVFPPLGDVLASFRETWLFARAGSDIVPSLSRLLAGLLLATVVGIAGGLALGRLAMVSTALNPSLQFLRSIPGTSLVPISVLLMGIGDISKIAVISVVCLFPVLLNAADAARGVDPLLEEVARSYRLTRRQWLLDVLLPASAPQIFAGIRTALGIAFIMMVVTELVAATNGIGYVTGTARNTFDVPQMWAGMLLLGLLGVGINGVFVAMQGRLLRWHTAMAETN